MADRIAAAGFDYVGISLDGRPETHDRVRRQAGAYDLARRGLRLMRDRGVKVGIRFTLTERNAADLDHLLGLMETESIDRFYLSHLNYGGRGNVNRGRDALHESTRHAMTRIFDACWAGIGAGRPREFTSGNNDADGVFLLQWAQARMPERAADLQHRLEQWGGNATGVAIANIDNLGNVHPDTYWWDHTSGQRPAGEILRHLARHERPADARPEDAAAPGQGTLCHLRASRDLRRQHACACAPGHGRPVGGGPGCYLTDAEIGIEEGARRVTVTPYRRSAGGETPCVICVAWRGVIADVRAAERSFAPMRQRTIRRALRLLPRCRSIGRHGAGAAAGEPGAAEARGCR